MSKSTIKSKGKHKTKPKSKSNPKYNSKNIQSTSLKKLISKTIAERKDLSKSQNNLAAKIIEINNKQATLPNYSYSKSISSSYSTTIHNGEVNRAGKEVIDDSTKPFIQVSELHNNHLDQYIIPRNQSNKTMHNKKPRKIKKTKIAKKVK